MTLHQAIGGPARQQGTFLRVDRDGGFTLKCADSEPTRSCMDAMAPLLDKLAGARGAAQR